MTLLRVNQVGKQTLNNCLFTDIIMKTVFRQVFLFNLMSKQSNVK